ncbi:MAG: tape measure protein, partial [Geminicoccaceae bacterium]
MADFVINVVVNTRDAAQGVQRVDRSLTSIERSLNRIQRLVGTVFAFTAIAGSIRSITNLADALTNAENRLKSLGIVGRDTAATTAELFRIANETRQSFAGVAEIYSRSTQALRLLGAEEQEVIDFTRTLNQAVAISGATTAEADGALRQFAQGLGRGELRGQELISVLEQLPIVADIIADRLGVTRIELNALAAEGAITSQVIREAFAQAREEIEERFARTIPTIAQSFVILQNRLIEVGGGFLKASGASEVFSRSVIGVADNLETVIRTVGALAVALAINLAGRAIPLVIAGVNALTVAVARNPFGALIIAISTAIGFLTTFADQIRFTNDGVATLADV